MFEQEIDGVQYVTVPKELWDKMWDVFEKIEVLKSVTAEDVNERLKNILNTENSSISVVNKKEM